MAVIHLTDRGVRVIANTDGHHPALALLSLVVDTASRPGSALAERFGRRSHDGDGHHTHARAGHITAHHVLGDRALDTATAELERLGDRWEVGLNAQNLSVESRQPLRVRVLPELMFPDRQVERVDAGQGRLSGLSRRRRPGERQNNRNQQNGRHRRESRRPDAALMSREFHDVGTGFGRLTSVGAEPYA